METETPPENRCRWWSGSSRLLCRPDSGRKTPGHDDRQGDDSQHQQKVETSQPDQSKPASHQTARRLAATAPCSLERPDDSRAQHEAVNGAEEDYQRHQPDLDLQHFDEVVVAGEEQCGRDPPLVRRHERAGHDQQDYRRPCHRSKASRRLHQNSYAEHRRLYDSTAERHYDHHEEERPTYSRHGGQQMYEDRSPIRHFFSYLGAEIFN